MQAWFLLHTAAKMATYRLMTMYQRVGRQQLYLERTKHSYIRFVGGMAIVVMDCRV